MCVRSCVLSMRTLHVTIPVAWSSFVFFFFSSRRRHTRFKCDWSSDVCSSDLIMLLAGKRHDRDRETFHEHLPAVRPHPQPTYVDHMDRVGEQPDGFAAIEARDRKSVV